MKPSSGHKNEGSRGNITPACNEEVHASFEEAGTCACGSIVEFGALHTCTQFICRRANGGILGRLRAGLRTD